MAKEFTLIEEDDDDFDPSIAAKKIPGNFTRGRNVRQDYMDIPVEQIVPFHLKGRNDFTRMEGDNFNSFVRTVEQDDILEALIVRAVDDSHYEVLAGETRWRAAKELGKPTVPCRVLQDCSDEKALRIFTVTNLFRRDLSAKDQAYGCYLYYEAIKKSDSNAAQALQGDMEEAGLSNAKVNRLQLRQIIKYHKIYGLEEPFLAAMNLEVGDPKRLGVEAAYCLTFLTMEQRQELIGKTISLPQARQLKELAQSEQWDSEAVAAIFNPLLAQAKDAPLRPNFSQAVKRCKKILQKQLNPAMWDKADAVLEEAMELYFKKHPKDRIKTK